MGQRLDVRAAPAALVEKVGITVDDGVVRPNIDESARSASKQTVEQDVFLVLRVRNAWDCREAAVRLTVHDEIRECDS